MRNGPSVQVLADRQAQRRVRRDADARRHERPVRLGDDDRDIGVRVTQGAKRLGIQMVGVVVARRDHVDEVQPRRIDHALGHPHMWLVGAGVLDGQRVRQVRVEQQVRAVELHQETALSQPPQAHVRVAHVGRPDVEQQVVVFLYRHDHGRPSSSRTRLTPSTMCASFWRAAHRAVWLRPQSGANANRSGRCEREAATDARGHVLGRLDVVALDVDDAHRHVHALRNGLDHVELGELAAGHLHVQFVDVRVEERRKQAAHSCAAPRRGP